jgi:hypothetical protein
MKKKELKRLYPLLELLVRLPVNDRETLLTFLNEEGCGGIYECIHNGLCNTEIPKNNRKAISKNLRSEKAIYRYLLKNSVSPKRKRKKLIQVGRGGLGTLINSVLPMLSQHLFAK